MSERSQQITDYLAKQPDDVKEPERRIMAELVRKNLVFLSEAEQTQAKYLLGNARKSA